MHRLYFTASFIHLPAFHSTGDRVTLTFTHMDVDSTPATGNCSGYYIRVLNGDDTSAPLIGIYCGNAIPTAITSSGSALTVMFVSDQTRQRVGFHATYSSASTGLCASLLTPFFTTLRQNNTKYRFASRRYAS